MTFPPAIKASRRLSPVDPKTGRKRTFDLAYAIVAVCAIFFLREAWLEHRKVDEISYSDFRALLEAGRISAVSVGDSYIRGTIASPAPGEKPEFLTDKVDLGTAELLSKYPIKYKAERDIGWLKSLLSWIIPTALFAGVWFFLVRRLQGSAGGGLAMMTIGKSKARIYLEKKTGVDFADVAGVDEAKAELKEIVDFLKDPISHARLGARLPKGVLLVGPPGTGKTLLARAVAGEAGVAFFSISGSEFVEMFVGVGAARVRDLFEQAREHSPCIIFIDELDALGRARGAFALGGHDEKEQTLNQLLAELDGFDPESGIILLAATNRPEILDPALLRAGRFDRQILVDRPDKKGRVEILAVHVRKVKLSKSTDLNAVAELTVGFTGADLANLVNEAALVATRRNAKDISLDDFTQAIERIVAGLEKRNRILNAAERETIAVHEVGHALVAMAQPGTDPVMKISIIPRGIGALGYTIQRPIEERFLMRKSDLERRLAMLLGGRAAELLHFGSVSSGAADDLQKATDIARHMVTRLGMVSSLGLVAYEREDSPFLPPVPGAPHEQRWYSEATSAKIDAAVVELLDKALRAATSILELNRSLLEEMTRALIEHETLGLVELQPVAKRIVLPEN